MRVVKYFHHGLCPNLSRVLSSVRRMMCSAAATLNLWRADSQRVSVCGLECSDHTHQTLVSLQIGTPVTQSRPSNPILCFTNEDFTHNLVKQT